MQPVLFFSIAVWSAAVNMCCRLYTCGIQLWLDCMIRWQIVFAERSLLLGCCCCVLSRTTRRRRGRARLVERLWGRERQRRSREEKTTADNSRQSDAPTHWRTSVFAALDKWTPRAWVDTSRKYPARIHIYIHRQIHTHTHCIICNADRQTDIQAGKQAGT